MAKKKILLIDDERFMRHAVASKLKDEGYAIIETKNGDEGLEMANREKPDMIILAVLMPGKIGFTVLEELKKDAETKDIPVIVFTRLSESDGEDTSMKLGAAKFVSKLSSSLEDMLTEAKMILEK